MTLSHHHPKLFYLSSCGKPHHVAAAARAQTVCKVSGASCELQHCVATRAAASLLAGCAALAVRPLSRPCGQRGQRASLSKCRTWRIMSEDYLAESEANKAFESVYMVDPQKVLGKDEWARFLEFTGSALVGSKSALIACKESPPVILRCVDAAKTYSVLQQGRN
eukprot:TRINITY_DN17609_c1_g1_i2.p1 TRINITY_DN17609_c1_g1~~TRINITY_DN17609_c1_g1_i2.p1  ORF type:complete len:165 (+),score=5.38 TRINITY_DN17609_c1_g1_i2:227-721(+)